MKTKMKTLMIAMNSTEPGREDPDFALLRLTDEVTRKLTLFRELHRKQAEAMSLVMKVRSEQAEPLTRLVVSDYSPTFPFSKVLYNLDSRDLMKSCLSRMDELCETCLEFPKGELDEIYGLARFMPLTVCEATISDYGVSWRAYRGFENTPIETAEVPWSVLIGEGSEKHRLEDERRAADARLLERIKEIEPSEMLLEDIDELVFAAADNILNSMRSSGPCSQEEFLVENGYAEELREAIELSRSRGEID